MANNNELNINDDIVLFCAFRYALGRMTYVVGSVCDKLISEYHNLSESTRCQYAREIEEAEREDRLGMEVDKTDWLKVKHLFLPEFHCHVRTTNNEIKEAVKFNNEYYRLDMKVKFYNCTEIL